MCMCVCAHCLGKSGSLALAVAGLLTGRLHRAPSTTGINEKAVITLI